MTPTDDRMADATVRLSVRREEDFMIRAVKQLRQAKLATALQAHVSTSAKLDRATWGGSPLPHFSTGGCRPVRQVHPTLVRR